MRKKYSGRERAGTQQEWGRSVLKEVTKDRRLGVLRIISQTDISTPLTSAQIVMLLEGMGIVCDRKTVLRDIKCLIDNDYDILAHPNNKLGFYLASRNFEDWELKILMDSVCACHFLTQQQSDALLSKLTELGSPTTGRLLESLSPLSRRFTPEKSFAKYNLDKILHAIKNGAQLSFCYMEMGLNKEFVPRREGRPYVVNPYGLVLSEQRYYLVCNTAPHDGLGYYRVDRMRSPQILQTPLRPVTDLAGMEEQSALQSTIANTFYMYTGTPVQMTLRCQNKVAEDILERFGSQVELIPKDSNSFEVTCEVVQSEGLFHWLLQYGTKVQVIAPKDTRKHVVKLLDEIRRGYLEE